MIRKTIALLAGLLLVSGVAQASVINFSGAITNVDGFGTDYAVGDTFIGKLILADAVDLSPGSSFGNGDEATPDDLTKSLQLVVGGTDFVNDLTSYSGTVSQSGNDLSGFIADSGPDQFGTCSFCSAVFRDSSFDITDFFGGSISGTVSTMISRVTHGTNDVSAPANWALFGLGVVGIFAVARRRRSTQRSMPVFA